MKSQVLKNLCTSSILFFVMFLLFTDDFFNSISYSISVVAFLYFSYEKFLWRFDPFNKVPRIYGKYMTNIESTYKGCTNYQSSVLIRQTLSKITITEQMRDGVCVSIISSLYRYADDGQWFLCYTYLTHPQNKGDDMHFGTSILYVKNKNTLEGYYFTNRIEQTRGKQVFTRVKRVKG